MGILLVEKLFQPCFTLMLNAWTLNSTADWTFSENNKSFDPIVFANRDPQGSAWQRMCLTHCVFYKVCQVTWPKLVILPVFSTKDFSKVFKFEIDWSVWHNIQNNIVTDELTINYKLLKEIHHWIILPMLNEVLWLATTKFK